MSVIIDYQGHKFIIDNQQGLQHTIGASIQSANIKVTQSFKVFFEKVMKLFPLTNDQSEILPLYKHVGDLLEAGLNNVEKPPVPPNVQAISAHGYMIILKAMCEQRPEFLDRYIPAMFRAIQKLAKDHITPQPMDVAMDNRTANPNLQQSVKKIVKDTGATLLLAIGLLSTR